jgi:single-strand DNA-binding protein
MALPVIIIEGNVALEPNLQFTANGKPLAKIRVAAGERKKDEGGNWVDGDVTFLDCVIWGAAAEAAVETISKGSPVIVVGKLKSRTIEDGGVKKTYFDVAVDNIAVNIKKSVKAETSDPWATGAPF